ncbi:hypothetical protein PMAYCL1PPCAC_22376, partial [Pristionchus mayeri]
ALADFSLCTHLLRNSTIVFLRIDVERMDDTLAAHILSLASHAQKILIVCDDPQLSDPAAFITNLASSLIFVDLRDRSCTTSSFFG